MGRRSKFWLAVMVGIATAACARSRAARPTTPIPFSARTLLAEVDALNDDSEIELRLVAAAPVGRRVAEHYRASNGVEFLFLPDPEAKVLSVQHWYPFGYLTEDDLPRQLDLHGPAFQSAWSVSARALAAEHEVGVAQRTCFESITIPALDGEALGQFLKAQIAHVDASIEARTKNPLGPGQTPLEWRLARIAIGAKTSSIGVASAIAPARLQPEEGLTVLAGRFDRVSALRALRDALGKRVRSERRTSRRVPLSAAGSPLRHIRADLREQRIFLHWSTWEEEKTEAVFLERIALLFAKRFDTLLTEQTPKIEVGQVEVRTGVMSEGLSISATIPHTESATIAASNIRAALAALGDGRVGTQALERVVEEQEIRLQRGLDDVAHRAMFVAAGLLGGVGLDELDARRAALRAEPTLLFREVLRTRIAAREPIVSSAGRAP